MRGSGLLSCAFPLAPRVPQPEPRAVTPFVGVRHRSGFLKDGTAGEGDHQCTGLLCFPRAVIPAGAPDRLPLGSRPRPPRRPCSGAYHSQPSTFSAPSLGTEPAGDPIHSPLILLTATFATLGRGGGWRGWPYSIFRPDPEEDHRSGEISELNPSSR